MKYLKFSKKHHIQNLLKHKDCNGVNILLKGSWNTTKKNTQYMSAEQETLWKCQEDAITNDTPDILGIHHWRSSAVDKEEWMQKYKEAKA